MAAYVDASAAVKLVLDEPESTALREWLRPRTARVSSALLRTEVIRAIGRQDRDRLSLARRVVSGVTLVAITDSVLSGAAEIEPSSLRSLDAVHLATALHLADELEAIVTYDPRMIDGAQALGLPVASPS